MPYQKMVTEEIQAKMAAIYPHYQALQRDGSVSMSANETQQLLDIHKALFSQNFCTTCPPAILKALEMCFRHYEDTQKVSFDIEETYPKPMTIEVLGQTEVEWLNSNSSVKAAFLSPEDAATQVAAIKAIEAKKYVFAGTNKQRKKLKQVFGNDFTETVTGFIVVDLKDMGYLNWFKEV